MSFVTLEPQEIAWKKGDRVPYSLKIHSGLGYYRHGIRKRETWLAVVGPGMMVSPNPFDLNRDDAVMTFMAINRIQGEYVYGPRAVSDFGTTSHMCLCGGIAYRYRLRVTHYTYEMLSWLLLDMDIAGGGFPFRISEIQLAQACRGKTRHVKYTINRLFEYKGISYKGLPRQENLIQVLDRTVLEQFRDNYHPELSEYRERLIEKANRSFERGKKNYNPFYVCRIGKGTPRKGMEWLPERPLKITGAISD